MTKLKFLGSGCWQGVPSQFCDDEVSRSVEWNSKDFRFRTSLFIQTQNNKTIVVEITPDIRLQAWKFKLKVPDAFLISHWHWDHLFGIQDLDWFFEKYSPKVYANKETKEWYDDRMNYIPVDFLLFKDNECFQIDNLKITTFKVYHTENTNGFLFENVNTGDKIAYCSDLNGMPNDSLEMIKNVKTVIVDATYLEGGAIGDDVDHFIGDEIIDFCKKLNSKDIIFTNINSHHNMNHEQLQKKYKDYTIAYDGLEKEF